MKRIVSLILFVLVLGVASAGAASVPRSELALGPVAFGDSKARVTELLGEPTERNLQNGGQDVIWNYNQSFYIYFSGERMAWMMATEGCTMATPSGIAVGAPETVLSGYGETYSDDVIGGVREVAFWAPGRLLLEFAVKNGKIRLIRVSH